ncbi:conserved hypothetical protein [Ricinus communis]|uniref:Uncharacterized protein n=1 Tax=Ricinus communis TaxID=3988 RepID=B9RNT3_RICCO|nr:conserved hypothetical protein [Ricinus communis]
MKAISIVCMLLVLATTNLAFHSSSTFARQLTVSCGSPGVSTQSLERRGTPPAPCNGDDPVPPPCPPGIISC